MKLNLGCGNNYLKGYINVDCDKTVKAEKYFDLNKIPYPLEDNCADSVICSHVIEHLSISPPEFLLECRRILKRSGTLNLVFPNMWWWHTRFQMLLGNSLWHKWNRHHINPLIKPTWVMSSAKMIGFTITEKRTGGITGFIFRYFSDWRDAETNLVLTRTEQSNKNPRGTLPSKEDKRSTLRSTKE